MGAAHVPEDRQRDGLVLAFPVAKPGAEYLLPYAVCSQGVVMQEKAILTDAER